MIVPTDDFIDRKFKQITEALPALDSMWDKNNCHGTAYVGCVGFVAGMKYMKKLIIEANETKTTEK